jgi:hypothetical protein
MKVICVDNLNRDYHPAQVITVGGLPIEIAEQISVTLNEYASHSDYYKVVEDDYEPNFDNIGTLNGEQDTFDEFVKTRGYLGFPKSVQEFAYNEYLKN